MNERFLEGRTALVTGSTSGIGLAIAQALAAAGAKIAINGLGTPEQIASAIAEVDAAGAVGTKHFGADLRDPDAIETMMADLAEWSGGGIDILVNNAGIQHAVPLHEMPVQKWNDIIAINLSSAFHTLRAAMPAMAERGYGRVINIASVNGIEPPALETYAYSTSKAGCIMLTRHLAKRLAPEHILVNAIAPGPFQSHMMAATLARAGDAIAKANPRGRIGTPEDIAGVAIFLASRASAYTTGTVVPCDGGSAEF